VIFKSGGVLLPFHLSLYTFATQKLPLLYILYVHNNFVSSHQVAIWLTSTDKLLLYFSLSVNFPKCIVPTMTHSLSVN
jgi:hypothetical protein